MIRTVSDENLLKVILTILFLGCLLDWDYGYYQLVRFIGMIGFAMLAYYEYPKKSIWMIVWISSAILINPLVKISLGRTIWNIVDVVWAVLLIGSIFSKTNHEHKSKEDEY